MVRRYVAMPHGTVVGGGCDVGIPLSTTHPTCHTWQSTVHDSSHLPAHKSPPLPSWIFLDAIVTIISISSAACNMSTSDWYSQNLDATRADGATALPLPQQPRPRRYNFASPRHPFARFWRLAANHFFHVEALGPAVRLMWVRICTRTYTSSQWAFAGGTHRGDNV